MSLRARKGLQNSRLLCLHTDSWHQLALLWAAALALHIMLKDLHGSPGSCEEIWQGYHFFLFDIYVRGCLKDWSSILGVSIVLKST